MVKKASVLCSILVLCLALAASAEEAAKPEAVTPETAVPAAPETVIPAPAVPMPAPAEEGIADFEAVYGEVKGVDVNSKTLTLETYDYDQEKEVIVTYTIKPDAELEGVKGLSEIKVGDWVDLELEKDPSGNLAVSFISVEREPIEGIVEEEVVE